MTSLQRAECKVHEVHAVQRENWKARSMKVRVATHLCHFTGVKPDWDLNAQTVTEAIDMMDQQHPGFASYVLHENGELRQHVNLFIGNRLIRDKEALSENLNSGDELVIMQALSGG